jgi:MFS family permease
MVLAISSSLAVALGALLFLMICTNLPFGIATAALQSMTPNEMRGRISALLLFLENALGMVLGPLIPALLTDNLFHGLGAKTGLSLALTVMVMGVSAAISMAIALRYAPTENQAVAA